MSDEINYGPIRSVEELGRIARAHRKQRGLNLEHISGLSKVSMRFLSEFERGKETAEIGKVLQTLRILGLEVIVQPRGVVAHADRNSKLASPVSKSGLPQSHDLPKELHDKVSAPAKIIPAKVIKRHKPEKPRKEKSDD